jgi:hypothetical protein
MNNFARFIVLASHFVSDFFGYGMRTYGIGTMRTLLVTYLPSLWRAPYILNKVGSAVGAFTGTSRHTQQDN